MIRGALGRAPSSSGHGSAGCGRRFLRDRHRTLHRANDTPYRPGSDDHVFHGRRFDHGGIHHVDHNVYHHYDKATSHHNHIDIYDDYDDDGHDAAPA